MASEPSRGNDQPETTCQGGRRISLRLQHGCKRREAESPAFMAGQESPDLERAGNTATWRMSMKLGSLFDGSGGFPLAGALFGIEPVWASEIEPFPIRVTKQRFPGMKHLGSVTDVKGDEVEPVDIITFGSPCQDLSVAGKQAGIHEGERSSLFFEAIRIIKEMRDATSNQFPRFAVWENVPGAFSSNKGKDFIAVLQAFSEICCPEAIVPVPPKGRLEHS